MDASAGFTINNRNNQEVFNVIVVLLEHSLVSHIPLPMWNSNIVQQGELVTGVFMWCLVCEQKHTRACNKRYTYF